jgi:hypothetical protein
VRNGAVSSTLKRITVRVFSMRYSWKNNYLKIILKTI